MADAAYLRESRSGPRLKALPAILALAILALGASLTLLLGARARVTHWNIDASANLQSDALRSSLEAKYGLVPFYSLDTRKIEAELAANPEVRKATVGKSFPGTVRISLEGRVAVLAALCEVDGRSQAVLVDRDGVAFRIGADPESADLPVLSGLRFENPSPGMRLPDSLLPLVSAIATLKESGSGLLGIVSEIRFVRNSPEGGECLIYAVGSRIPVRVSAGITAETLKSAALIQDVMKKRGIEGSVKEIDLRSGAIVYKTKEGGA